MLASLKLYRNIRPCRVAIQIGRRKREQISAEGGKLSGHHGGVGANQRRRFRSRSRTGDYDGNGAATWKIVKGLPAIIGIIVRGLRPA